MKDRNRTSARARVLAFTVGASLLAIMAAGPQAADASCTSRYPEVPCIGPIQSEYGFTGSGYGALSYVGAKAGPEEMVGTPAPGKPVVYRRVFTIHTGHQTRFAAAFILHGGSHGHYQYQRVIPRHGKITLTGGRNVRKSILLLEGRQEAHTSITALPPSAVARAASHCYVREVPCLGRIQTLLAFNGSLGGAVHSIHVTPGPEEAAGTDPEGKPIKQRKVNWKSIPTVTIVVVYRFDVRPHG
jgi:hypothetical protein